MGTQLHFIYVIIVIACSIIRLIGGLTSKNDGHVCDKYEEVEKKFECGINGYPIHFGLKNCLIFNNESTRKMFSKDGQKFLDCSTKCLLSEFHNISETSTTCSQLHEKAFKSHVSCYLLCDFCEICKTQKYVLMKSYDWADFLSIDAVQQVSSVIRKCGFFHCLF